MSVRSKREGVAKVLTPKQKYAFISTREFLRYSQLNHGRDKLYVPPDNEQATIFMDLITITTRPGFLYKNQFNKL